MSAKNFLNDATPEELVACVQLLALSVVHHREESAFVTLSDTADRLRARAEKPDKSVLQQREVAEETLEVARIMAEEVQRRRAEKSRAEAEAAEAAKGPAEKRNQLRMNVIAPVGLIWPGETEPVAAKLENISWGGAAIRVDSLNPGGSDTVQILLPSPKGKTIPIQAKILRTWELEEGGGYGIGTRFVSLSMADEEELENVLELLIKTAESDGQREHARLTKRMSLEFDDAQELQATLEDISEGGLGITVPDPMQIGQSLQTVISATDGEASVKLRARVVRQEPIDFGKTQFYRVGLKLEHPVSDLAALMRGLMKKLD